MFAISSIYQIVLFLASLAILTIFITGVIYIDKINKCIENNKSFTDCFNLTKMLNKTIDELTDTLINDVNLKVSKIIDPAQVMTQLENIDNDLKEINNQLVKSNEELVSLNAKIDNISKVIGL